MATARAFVLRMALAALLLLAYLYVWRPYGRPAAVRAVAAPLLGRVAEQAPGRWDVRPAPRRLLLRNVAQGAAPAASAPEKRSFRWTAPAGVRFLLPALGLMLAAPRRLYWLYLWGGHVALGGLGIGLLGLGMVGGGAWFAAYDVLTRYLIDAFSLGLAAGAVVTEFDLGPAPPQAAPAPSDRP